MAKKLIFLLMVSCTLSAQAVERVLLEDLQSNWSSYTNQMVRITTPLVVCGSFYDSLVLAPERLFCPDERALGLADGDSTMYYDLAAQNEASSIVVHCRNNYYEVRSGDIVTNLEARVTKERHLLTGKTVKTRHMPKDRLAKPKKGELRVYAGPTGGEDEESGASDAGDACGYLCAMRDAGRRQSASDAGRGAQ